MAYKGGLYTLIYRWAEKWGETRTGDRRGQEGKGGRQRRYGKER